MKPTFDDIFKIRPDRTTTCSDCGKDLIYQGEKYSLCGACAGEAEKNYHSAKIHAYVDEAEEDGLRDTIHEEEEEDYERFNEV
jgi:predicted amidophosphoribosyltransferase